MTRLTDDELLAWLDECDESSGYGSSFADCAARLRELLAEREWQPIETAPRDKEVLLSYVLRGREHKVQSAILTQSIGPNIWSWSIDDNKYGPYPIRGYVSDGLLGWRPLPDPPESEIR